VAGYDKRAHEHGCHDARRAAARFAWNPTPTTSAHGQSWCNCRSTGPFSARLAAFKKRMAVGAAIIPHSNPTIIGRDADL